MKIDIKNLKYIMLSLSQGYNCPVETDWGYLQGGHRHFTLRNGECDIVIYDGVEFPDSRIKCTASMALAMETTVNLVQLLVNLM